MVFSVYMRRRYKHAEKYTSGSHLPHQGKRWYSSWKIWYCCWNTILIDTLEMAQYAATGDILQEKVFLEISQNAQEKTCARASFLNKTTYLMPATLLKRKLWRRSFLVNFANFLRTLFVHNAHGRPLLEFQLFSVLLWRPLMLSSERKAGNLLHRIEIWLLIQFIWLEIFSQELYLEVCLSVN